MNDEERMYRALGVLCLFLLAMSILIYIKQH